ncbi:YafY family transcriptional regulator [Ideonella dechloratans]|uniref:YafY family transcriptional regulator n=1 Tax=Ideonella dechloratans TaxID=36863 RepID=A0A643FA73_IDEDE|nr:YafY family protein [Ideonella dechloratans]KAB0580808.1 YafY family transcriptional regulator [Ideonella dechloratans]UFU10398.1 YafY family transcriptional regulator [Ideonella dechloratans]
MRRADRLFRLTQLIRGRRRSTAAWLSERLEVSLRTVYRDVADLQAQGVPIEGEAGVGYRMGAGFDLPPLMFSAEEACALVAALRLAQPQMDPALAAQGELALGRILSVLPPSVRAQAEGLALWVPANGPDAAILQRLGLLRQAIAGRQRVQFCYRDAGAQGSQRTVRPLGCFFWGQVWTLGAWCELRQDFRSFRLDRIDALATQDSRFRHEPGRGLADYLRHAGAPAHALTGGGG